MADGGVLRNVGAWADLPAHPLADIFPMLPEDELQALADDIAANGQQYPILIDADATWIVDGRNRLAACKLAGIEPKFEFAAEGADLLAIIVSRNIKRRNLTAGQKAIAAADAWLQAETAGLLAGKGRPKNGIKYPISEGQRTRAYFAEQFGASEAYVRKARELLENDTAAAEIVRRGDMTIADAYQLYIARLDDHKAAERRLRELGRDRPDLAERVRKGEIDLDDALALRTAEAEALKRRRFVISKRLIEVAGAIDLDTSEALVVADLYDPAVIDMMGEAPITRERLARIRDFFAVLTECWPQDPGP